MNSAIQNSLLVGAGGFLGSIFRYLISSFMQQSSQDWPIGTLTANLLGCFIIGIFCHTMPIGRALDDNTKLFLAIGFCGGLTTASSFIQQVVTMHRTGNTAHAAIYLLLTIVLTIPAFYAGLQTSRLLARD